MNCPICKSWTTVHITIRKDTYVQRTRECGNRHKFTTEERVVSNRTHGGDRKSAKAKEKIE